MKKVVTIILILFLSSCVTYNQEHLNLNVSIAKKYSDFGNNKPILVKVIDERNDKNLLGNKRLGESLIAIKSDQSLVEVAKNKIIRDLEQNGFLASSKENKETLADKSLEVKIITFNYNGYREFFVGSSKIEVAIQINAKDNVKNTEYSTIQSFAFDKKHFIMPLITTDEKTINFALQEALDGIFNDQKLLSFLQN